MKCLCGCGKEFEPTRRNQVYFDAKHRQRDRERRYPRFRVSVSREPNQDSLRESQQARAECGPQLASPLRAQPSDSPQILTPSEISELQNIDEIICRAKLLTGREVAELLGVSVSTLHDWRRLKRNCGLRFVRFSGDRVRYRLRDLAMWIDKLGVVDKEGR